MKNLSTIFIALIFLNSCATYAPISHEEHCALDGMTLDGISRGNNSQSVYINGQSGVSHSASIQRHCSVPKNENAKDEVRRSATSAIPKANYNSRVHGARILIYVGYIFGILPGIAGKIYMDSEKSDAMESSRAPASKD